MHRFFVHIGMVAVVCIAAVGCYRASVRPLVPLPDSLRSDTAGEETTWRWFMAEPGGNTAEDAWETQSGTAKVKLTRQDIHADLFFQGELRHWITGIRDGNHLKVKLSTEGSCLVDYPMEGFYVNEAYEHMAYTSGRETIMLSDNRGVVVGFTRLIYNSRVPSSRIKERAQSASW